MQALVGLLALRAHGCLWLFMLALVTVDARVAAAAGAPRGLLSGRSLRPGAVEPQQFLEGKRKPQAQVVEAAARPSCKDDSEFEDELDSLSWELFTSPIGAGIPSPVRAPVPQAGAQEPGRAKLSAHAAPARRGRTAASLDLAGAAQERREKYSAAAAARLARWMQAVDRTQNFSKGDQRPAVLPPACPAVVPASDPYWTQKDSYAVKSGDQWIQYNECRYSENCTKQYTNLDRVNSIRKTLSITHKFLDKFNVQHGLYGGSAIGALRCQDVLPWDVDSDVFVLQQDFLKLSIMLDGMRNDTGWQGVGRSINMVGFGAEFDGFILMEKFPGCQPLVIVDKSTGFFTDLFPLEQHGSNVLVPWWAGEVVCDTQTLFHGCPTGKCHQWTLNNTLPPSR